MKKGRGGHEREAGFAKKGWNRCGLNSGLTAGGGGSRIMHSDRENWLWRFDLEER